jgi:hypothetical protein
MPSRSELMSKILLVVIFLRFKYKLVRTTFKLAEPNENKSTFKRKETLLKGSRVPITGANVELRIYKQIVS